VVCRPPSRTQLFLLVFQYGDPALTYKTTKKNGKKKKVRSKSSKILEL